MVPFCRGAPFRPRIRVSLLVSVAPVAQWVLWLPVAFWCATEAPPKRHRRGSGCFFRWRSTVSVVYRCTLTAVCCRVWRVWCATEEGVVRHRRGCGAPPKRVSAPPGFGGASVAHQGPTETVLRSGRLGPGCPMLVGAGGLAGLGELAGVLACVPWPGHGSYNHH